MQSLSYKQQKAVDKYEPITINGLTLWPITVEEYGLFTAASAGIELMPQELPLDLISLPVLAALYRMDYRAVQAGEPTAGLFASCLLFLALALRLGRELEAEERVRLFRLAVDPQDNGALRALSFEAEGGAREITPAEFSALRPILAAQNGIRLEAADANPELVQAERDLLALRAPKLELSMNSLVSGVAALSGAEERDIYDWPILKLRRREAALKRAMDYIVCGINEGAGCKWKGGNPAPSPWFDRVRDSSAALIPMAEFAGGAGARAAQTPGQRTT